MAIFDYTEMQQTTLELLTEFGNSFTLKKPFGEPVYNPKTRRTEQNFKTYTGIGVMKTYTSEMIGFSSNVVQAGDVDFKCVIDNQEITPKEGTDKIEFNGRTYNIINVAEINPPGDSKIIYTLYCRRAD